MVPSDHEHWGAQTTSVSVEALDVSQAVVASPGLYARFDQLLADPPSDLPLTWVEGTEMSEADSGEAR